MRRNFVVAALLFLLSIGFTAQTAAAKSKPSEYELIVRHLKTKYRAKKVNIPFIWFARFAVSMVRPAGVKSFSITLFEDLKFSAETLDYEMQEAMKKSFGEAEWSSILRARSAEGQQAYMYMRESGKNVKVALVAIDKKNAAIIRATFSPERLAEFINDPKLFGISLKDNGPPQLQQQTKSPDPQTTQPPDVQSDKPADVTTDKPADVKADKPAEVKTDKPADVAKDKPAVANDKSAEVAKDKPE